MDGDRLSDHEVALVLGRAAELDSPAVPGAALCLDAASVEQAAVEAGLSRPSVRQALAELRAGTLAERRRPRLPILGPRVLAVHREVPGPGARVEAVVGEFLRGQLFEMVRDFGGRTRWACRQGLKATVQRARDLNHRLVLNDVTGLDVTMVSGPGDDGLVLLRLEADV
ncbi:MAG: hypothetical protein ACRD0F_08320, partial [Acidimicrobiales bacterium]